VNNYELFEWNDFGCLRLLTVLLSRGLPQNRKTPQDAIDRRKMPPDAVDPMKSVTGIMTLKCAN